MNNVKILLIGETKLHSSFPDAQFFNEGCNKPLQLDVSGRSEGNLVFTKTYLPTKKLTKLNTSLDIQIIIFQLNLQKEKWLVVSVYKPPAKDPRYFLN